MEGYVLGATDGETLFTHQSVIKTTFLLYMTVVSAIAGV